VPDQRHHLRDKGWLQRQVEQHGSMNAAADAHGIPRSTFKDYWYKAGLEARGSGRPNAHRAKAVRRSVGEEVSQEELLRAEVVELRSQAKAARTGEVQFQKLLNVVSEKIDAKVPRYKPAPKERSRAFTTHRFVLQYSDTHAAEVVNPEEMNGINAYDWEDRKSVV